MPEERLKVYSGPPKDLAPESMRIYLQTVLHSSDGEDSALSVSECVSRFSTSVFQPFTPNSIQLVPLFFTSLETSLNLSLLVKHRSTTTDVISTIPR